MWACFGIFPAYPSHKALPIAVRLFVSFFMLNEMCQNNAAKLLCVAAHFAVLSGAFV